MRAWADHRVGIEGAMLPLDHGYMLMAALSTVLPEVHGGREPWAVHPVFGRRRGDTLELVPGKSSVKIRAPVDCHRQIADALSGAHLDVGTMPIRLAGTASFAPIVGAPDLRARFVTIKNHARDEDDFAAAVRASLGIMLGAVEADPSCSIHVERRRVIRIHGYRVVGFGVELRGLSEQASIAVQVVGIGGRRTCGAGVFVPCNPAATAAGRRQIEEQVRRALG